MKCINCNRKIPDKSKFCNHCGTKQKRQQLYRRPDGLYEKTLVINGKRKSFRGKTENDVFMKIANYNIELENEKRISFEKVADMWEDETFPTLAYNSLMSYRPKLKYAVEYFGSTPVSEINTLTANKYIQSLSKSYAYKTVAGYKSVASLVMTYACMKGYIEHNPFEYIKVPTSLKRSHRRATTSSEADIIRNSLDIDGGTLAYFFLYSGLRLGEALALTWNDVDFKEKTISVNKSLYWVGNTPYIKTPKTEKGKRMVVLVDCLAQVLEPLKKHKDDYVFNYDGKPYTKSKYEDLWQAYQKATGLKITPHNARHGFSTMCFDAKMQIKDVQDLMGHAQYSTTADIYTHITNEHKKESLETLNNYINKGA